MVAVIPYNVDLKQENPPASQSRWETKQGKNQGWQGMIAAGQ
jgi:hypothetical protein